MRKWWVTRCVPMLALPLPQQRLAGREGPVRVLVVGGSQGARILNQTMPQVAAKLGDSVTIWHQSVQRFATIR